MLAEYWLKLVHCEQAFGSTPEFLALVLLLHMVYFALLQYFLHLEIILLLDICALLYY